MIWIYILIGLACALLGFIGGLAYDYRHCLGEVFISKEGEIYMRTSKDKYDKIVNYDTGRIACFYIRKEE